MTFRRRSNARVICEWCEREVSARVPNKADGSAYVVFKHKDKRGEECTGSYRTVKAYGPHVLRHFWKRPRGPW